MKDSRVTVFRKTLEGLIESLDATVRLTRWSGEESIPEPLKVSASLLVDRLGTADRFASSTFNGAQADVARVNLMLSAMRRLDAAYVDYRQHLSQSATEREKAALALDAEIDAVKSDSRWRA
jgi:hypothetical protein